MDSVPLPLVVGLMGAVGTGIGVLYRAFVKGDLVPGSVYRDAVSRAEKAETQAERNTDAIEAVAAAVKAAGERASREAARTRRAGA